MGKDVYITDEERVKRKRVAEAFAELYEVADIVIADAGRYGFIKAQFYKAPRGFDSIVTYTDSQSMFEDLWDGWLCDRLLSPALETPIEEWEYEQIFEHLSEEKQEELMAKRAYFMGKCGAASAQKGKEGLKNEERKTSGHTGIIEDEGQAGQYPE